MTADLKIPLRYRGRPRIDPGKGGWMKPSQRDFLCFIFSHLSKAPTANDQPCKMKSARSVPCNIHPKGMTRRCQQCQQALLLPSAAPVPGKPAVGQASWASLPWASLPWAHFDTFCKKKERGGRSWKASSPQREENACKKSMGKRLPRLKGSKTPLKAKSY